MIPWLRPHDPFPPLESALRRPNGLLAAGSDLSVERLIDAYRHGIFPWFGEGEPVLWWSPDPRMVLFPNELNISRSLKKTLRKGGCDTEAAKRREREQPPAPLPAPGGRGHVSAEGARLREAPAPPAPALGRTSGTESRAASAPAESGARYEIRTDSAFEEVMKGCAAPRKGHSGTWITEEMIAAYAALHDRGLAHSVETWIDGKLAGGLYGVALGKAFFGESMFSRVTDSSKIALVYLAKQLQRWQFGMIDCQMRTSHLAALGAREIPRKEFMLRLKQLVNYPDAVGKWRFDHDLIE